MNSSKQLLQMCNPKIHPFGRTTPGSATYQFSFSPVPFIAEVSEGAARHSVLQPIRVGRRPRTCHCWLKKQTRAIHQRSRTWTASVWVESASVCMSMMLSAPDKSPPTCLALSLNCSDLNNASQPTYQFRWSH